MSEYPITPEGFEKLKQELQRLVRFERPKISQEIGTARELGDLSENFEYHAAKDRQGLIEAKIRDLEHKVAHANVIDPKKLSGKRVVFGAKVVLEYDDSDEAKAYQIVGESEADVELGKISVTSPVARALIGREVGDDVQLPGKSGARSACIVEVRFGD